MAETVESSGGDRDCRRRRWKSALVIGFIFIVVAAIGILDVGFDHRRAPASLPRDESDLPQSLKSRLIDLHARVVSAIKGALECAQK